MTEIIRGIAPRNRWDKELPEHRGQATSAFSSLKVRKKSAVFEEGLAADRIARLSCVSN
jgi:hypothetical protein